MSLPKGIVPTLPGHRRRPTIGPFDLRLPARRSFLCESLAAAGLAALWPALGAAAPLHRIDNVTGLYPVRVARIATPTTAAEVATALRAWPGKVAVGGGRYSMGGQVAIQGGLHLDMRSMKRLLWVRPAERLVRVQAGMRWRDLQDVLDPMNLAVQTMQSYANFTVGGSVAVNAHGRYVGNGAVGHSVRALQLVLADGSIVEASRSRHAELFGAAIGGYAALAVITEVELALAENVRLERTVTTVPLASYVQHFEQSVLGDPASVLHNADLLAPDFDAPVCVTWRQTDRPPTEPARLVPRGAPYRVEQNVLWAVTELPGGERLRASVIHPLLLARPAVAWRNHEASLDVAELEPRTRRMSSYVLQEFFIPKRNFLRFVQAFAKALRHGAVHAVNVSIRHSPPDRLSLLPWAREEVFCFVLYFKQRTHERALAEVAQWTRALIELALDNEGRYYLPYQLHATREQFDRAYPEAAKLRRLKREFDPTHKLSNELWAKYL